MVTAVLFDLDCTLVDRLEQTRRYAVQFAAHFRDHLVHADPVHLADVILAADGLGYRPATRFADMIEQLQWHYRPALVDLESHWYAHFASLAVAMDGAVEVLAALQTKGLSLGIITNGSVGSQRTKIDQLGLQTYCQAIVISEAVGMKKPDPAIFQHALDALGVPPASAWFVGDHPVNDIAGAQRAGLTPVWLAGSHPWPSDREPPPYRITHVSELLPLMIS
ncbi:MAG: HAD family hydrolase [Candidatus Tectomicrobia bacterium]|nr:HAD family hydrolase [Candidatus Tectomicrobia bacterium]